MKTQIFLASLLFAVSAFAESGPAPGQPFTFPNAVPPGTNSATYAAPRYSWVERVMRNKNDARQQAGNIQLIFDGDSITDGWHGGGKTIWAQRYGLNAFNFGIGGDRTENVLWRIAQGQTDGLHPKLIAIMIGTNNTETNTPEQIAEGVKAVVAAYQKHCPDAVILLQAIFPRSEKPDAPVRAKLKVVNEIISKLGDGKKVIYVDFSDKFLDAAGNLSKEIMFDGLHPSEKGYQIWADAIQPIIDQYIQPQSAK